MCKWRWKLEHDSAPGKVSCGENIWLGLVYIQLNTCPMILLCDHVRDIYLSGRSMSVKNGQRTHFWGDTWCGLTPLKNKLLGLFERCNEHDIIVVDAAHKGWQFTYRRWLTPDLQNLVSQINNFCWIYHHGFWQ
jgi:hypothetical protein